MKKGTVLQRIARAALIILIAAMLFLFFTNDFGLVDIHKASIVVAVGVDVTKQGYDVTAQAAVPTPGKSGEEQYTQVTGSGANVADAVEDINAKTGFYPKLTFCNLVVLGESCTQGNIFTVLDYFYRNDYVPLTALVGMCRGTAKEVLSAKPADGSMSASAISRAMSEELKNSANCSTVNLKLLAQDWGSQSAAAYMPLITLSRGGQASDSEGSGSSGGGSGGGSASSQSGGGAGGGSRGSSGEGAQFTCLTTAAFSGGRFVGELNEEQSFALNLMRSSIRLAVVNAVYDGENYTVGLKNNRGGFKVRAEGGVPVAKFTFSALANVQAAENKPAAEGSANSHLVSGGVLKAVAEEVEKRFLSLVDFCRTNGCDLLGVARLMHRHRYADYLALKDNLLPSLKVQTDIKISSVR